MLRAAVPVLAALDMGEALAFYARLGFQALVRYGDEYAIVERDGVEVHLWGCADRHVAENTACYLRVTDAAALHAEFAAAGAAVLRRPTVEPYGVLEFAITDPSGNLLRIGQSLDAGDG